MAKTKMSELERKLKATQYSLNRSARLRAAGACSMCARIKSGPRAGEKISLREPKAATEVVTPKAAPKAAAKKTREGRQGSAGTAAEVK